MIITHEFVGVVVVHFEEEELAILSPLVQAESGELCADTIIKNNRKSKEEEIKFSLCCLWIQLFGLFFSWNREKHPQKWVRCLRAANP